MRSAAVFLVLLAAGSTRAQSLRFEDVTEQTGMHLEARGHGVSVVDYDADGWPDIFVAVYGGHAALFRNNGDGTFRDVAGALGIDASGQYSTPLAADIDNDGRTDLAIFGETAPNRVYLATEDGRFQDISETAGIDVDARVASAAWGDFDDDGLVDLFLAVDRGPDQLYRNLGGGRFEDVSAPGGIRGLDHTVAMQATWFDYDHDGSQDLFVVHDGFDASRLHRNRGYLPLLNEASWLGFSEVGSGNSMGMAWADVDGDGWEDVYVTRIRDAGLYRNRGGTGFDLVDDAFGAWRNGMSWGTVFGDFDNDMDPDLFVVSTSGYDGTETLLYENRNGWYYDRSQSGNASFYVEAEGLATLDYDRDGTMDLVFPTHAGLVHLLRGVPEDPGNWTRLHLRGVTANRLAIGARVVAHVGDQVVTGWVSGGDSFCSQSEAVVHIGMGDATVVDRLTVYWGGQSADTFSGLAAGMDHTLEEGTGAASVALEPSVIPGNEPALRAFPNPFPADTNIRVDLPVGANTRLAVFDLLGRRVALLHEGWLPGGPSNLTLDSEALPPGTYFVRMETESTVKVLAITRPR